jgi:hypothetical protein
MSKESFLDYAKLLLSDLVEVISPAWTVLLIIGGVYAFLQLVSNLLPLIGEDNGDFSSQRILGLIVSSITKTVAFFIEQLPALIIILVTITGFSFIINIGKSFYSIYENQQRIKELTVFAKNLSSNNKIAQIKVCDKGVNDNGEYGTYKIFIYDGITGDVISEKTYQLQGSDLRLDSMVINFDYSEIGAGKQRNLAFPYRIFSNEISPKNATILDSMFTLGNPDEFIENGVESMLGLARDTFRKRAKEFIEIVKDPIKSQELGIRVAYGNTITIPANAQKGDEYVIYIEGTGGLSLREVSF